MQLFYHPELEDNADQFIFPTDESRHISKVLRKKSGDILQITNGKGVFFEAQILIPDHKKCTAKIISRTQKPPKPYQLHMVVAPTKLNDRFEWFLEKATEIGVHEITPIICDHSERKVIKMDRMEKVIQSAMKQSLQAYLPKLNPAIPFKEFIAQPKNGELYIAHCEEDKKKELSHIATAKNNTTILIGPEGDFSPEEIQLALQNGFQAVALGNTRLRTETAAIVACTAVAMINL
ncbi:16S rRNA (uracil(1498)-N(3))-methyltransferase [Arenibacter sp. BSSL-BM3]|uniref:Ribosomal RNA small subunit methyltransferase E n=1 Tax=Arenibacter arenosicollis TaxID=2762274 RepID=A0ABR7QRD8_9FLAO|nr:16S rRNA (uracil(1498)-N(3))-methyltransferase [Arenibacter arenosicollis]MBC8769743.1 16S rRNA (uracil(1498)-N(3))-methyltransferase [Arenibacter arenosicollis]